MPDDIAGNLNPITCSPNYTPMNYDDIFKVSDTIMNAHIDTAFISKFIRDFADSLDTVISHSGLLDDKEPAKENSVLLDDTSDDRKLPDDKMTPNLSTVASRVLDVLLQKHGNFMSSKQIIRAAKIPLGTDLSSVVSKLRKRGYYIESTQEARRLKEEVPRGLKGYRLLSASDAKQREAAKRIQDILSSILKSVISDIIRK